MDNARTELVYAHRDGMENIAHYVSVVVLSVFRMKFLNFGNHLNFCFFFDRQLVAKMDVHVMDSVLWTMENTDVIALKVGPGQIVPFHWR